jgi:hypothetical protein
MDWVYTFQRKTGQRFGPEILRRLDRAMPNPYDDDQTFSNCSKVEDP